jgi:fucose 4-O-acetylase-like acetyltransferase
MPAFVFISGYLFKISQETSLHCSRIIEKLVVPLCLFEAVYEFYALLTTGNLSGYALGLAPYWTLWYLLSLIFWSMLLPLIQPLKSWISIPFSIVVALAIGFSESIGIQFSLSRTLYFFPFFVVGYITSASSTFGDIKNNSNAQKMGLVVLFISLFFAVLLYGSIDASILYGSSGYGTERPFNLHPMVLRLAIIAVGFVMSFAIVGFFPLGVSFLSRFGKNSLAIFLIHGLAVRIISHFGITKLAYSYGDLIGLALTFLLSLILCYIMSFKEITDLIRNVSNKVFFHIRSMKPN